MTVQIIRDDKKKKNKMGKLPRERKVSTVSKHSMVTNEQHEM